MDFTRGGGELAKVKEEKAPEPKVVVNGNMTSVDVAAVPHQLKFNLTNRNGIIRVCKGTFWIFQAVSGLSGQFLGCRAVSWLSGQFLDYPHSF